MRSRHYRLTTRDAKFFSHRTHAQFDLIKIGVRNAGALRLSRPPQRIPRMQCSKFAKAMHQTGTECHAKCAPNVHSVSVPRRWSDRTRSCTLDVTACHSIYSQRPNRNRVPGKCRFIYSNGRNKNAVKSAKEQVGRCLCGAGHLVMVFVCNVSK